MPDNKNNDFNNDFRSLETRIDSVNKRIDDTSSSFSNKMDRQYNLLSTQIKDLGLKIDRLANSNEKVKSNNCQTMSIVISILLGFIAVATAIVK